MLRNRRGGFGWQMGKGQAGQHWVQNKCQWEGKKIHIILASVQQKKTAKSLLTDLDH